MAKQQQTRLCSNCRAVIPPGETSCPKCGTFAGDMFDGRSPAKARRRPVFKWFLTFAAIVLGAAIIGFIFYGDVSMIPKGIWPRTQKMDTGPVRVVSDRPGGVKRGNGAILSEPEATQTLRRSFAVKGECLAVINKGYRDGAYFFDATNRCKHKRLGHWKVDGKSGTVSAAVGK